MNLRIKRMLIRLVFHSAVLIILGTAALIATAIEGNGIAAFFTGFFLLYAVTVRANPLPEILDKSIFKEGECPACGEVIDLENNWNCGCGYQMWEPRHAFSRCPNCGKVFSWLVCPRCEGSIPI
ncbi:hypothetical protein ACFLYB_00325 [Chloroflexota bacterium]